MGRFSSFVGAVGICLLYHVLCVAGNNSFFFQPGAAITKVCTSELYDHENGLGREE
jgi:hypothetical protein